VQSFNNTPFMMVPKEKASFSLDSIDLTGITGMTMIFGGDKSPKFGYAFEVYLDGLNGKKIGEGSLPAGAPFRMGSGGFGGTMANVTMQPVTDGKMHNLYIVSRALNPAEGGTLVLLSVEFKAGDNAVASLRRPK
jgi:cytochrome c